MGRVDRGLHAAVDFVDEHSGAFVAGGVFVVTACTQPELLIPDLITTTGAGLGALFSEEEPALVDGVAAGAEGATAVEEAATAAADGEVLIYRAASGTPSSMTPRPVDAKGLSAANSLENALPGKNQIIDTSRFTNLCATCDNLATGHVSITPRDMSQMQSWIGSRGGVEIHPLTKELMDAVVGTVRK